MECADRIVLQRLLDGDLSPAQAELVSHHLASCAECRSVAQQLGELEMFARDWLGAEDESEEDAAAAALAAVAGRLPGEGRTPSRFRHAASSWLRRALVGAAAVLIVLLLPVVFDSRLGASADRILELADARERMWQYQPNTVLHWEVRATSTGVKGIADGTWRSLYWQKNGDSMLAQVWRQFDPQERLVRASWRLDDGSAMNFRPNGRDVVELLPPAATLRAALPGLSADLRTALEAYLSRNDTIRSLDFNSRRREAEWLNRPSPRTSRGQATLRTARVGESGEVFHITVVTDRFAGSPAILRAVHEYDVDKASMRLLRLKSSVGYADGTTGVHESRWVNFSRISAAEFDAQLPADLLHGTAAVVRLTPVEVATRHLEELNRARDGRPGR